MLARDLGMSAGQVMALPADEMTHWRALYNLEARERDRAQRDAKAKQLAGQAKRNQQSKG